MRNDAQIRYSKAFTVKNITVSGLCIALGILLPFITGNNRELGNMLCLMHIPVMLCGMLCGWQCGLTAGIITPLLRSVMLGMPPIVPSGICMAAELGVYGFLCGILTRVFPAGFGYRYVTLIIAMVAGRIISALANMAICGITSKPFSIAAYLAGVFVTALPGMALQLALLPPAHRLLDRALNRKNNCVKR